MTNATKPVSPEESQKLIALRADSIKDLAKKVQPYAEHIATALGYAQEWAKQTTTTVDDKIVVTARAVALLFAGGSKEIIEKL